MPHRRQRRRQRRRRRLGQAQGRQRLRRALAPRRLARPPRRPGLAHRVEARRAPLAGRRDRRWGGAVARARQAERGRWTCQRGGAAHGAEPGTQREAAPEAGGRSWEGRWPRAPRGRLGAKKLKRLKRRAKAVQTSLTRTHWQSSPRGRGTRRLMLVGSPALRGRLAVRVVCQRRFVVGLRPNTAQRHQSEPPLAEQFSTNARVGLPPRCPKLGCPGKRFHAAHRSLAHAPHFQAAQ